MQARVDRSEVDDCVRALEALVKNLELYAVDHREVLGGQLAMCWLHPQSTI
jgi:hypothetical protein